MEDVVYLQQLSNKRLQVGSIGRGSFSTSELRTMIDNDFDDQVVEPYVPGSPERARRKKKKFKGGGQDLTYVTSSGEQLGGASALVVWCREAWGTGSAENEKNLARRVDRIVSVLGQTGRTVGGVGYGREEARGQSSGGYVLVCR